MGLLDSMTIRFNIDLSPVKSGVADTKSLVSDLAQSVSSSSAALKSLDNTQMGSLIEAVNEVTTAIHHLAVDVTETTGAVSEAAASNEAAFATMASDITDELSEIKDQLAGYGEEAEEASEQASGGMSGFFARVREGGASLLDFGAKLGQTVFGLKAMGQAALGMVSGLFSSSQQIEEATNSFEVFDGSMQKAQAEMANLSSFAAHTPFETQSIDDAALKMQSVGISANNVIPYLHSLGDALDATGRVSDADLNMIVDDFDKIQTQGHLTTDVMNSFALQGVDAWSILEKQTGKSQAQLQQMISAGLYPANAAMHDLTTGIEANPLYTGQMANDTNSLTGILSTLKSNWDQALASFASPVMKDLEPILNDISTDLASPGFKDFASGVGAGIASIFGKIADAAKKVDFKALGDDAKRLGDWFNTSLKPAIRDAQPGFDKLATTLGQLAHSALPPLLDAAGRLIPKVVELAGDISGGLSTAISGISGSFSTWGPIVLGVGGALTVVFIPAIIKSGVESTVAGAKMAGQYIANVVKVGIEGWSAAGKLALFVGNLIASGVQASIAGIKIAAQWTAQAIAAGAKAVVAGAQIAASFIAQLVASGAQAVVAGAQIVGSFVASLIETGVQAAITAGALLADLIPAVASFVAGALLAAATAIPAVLIGFGEWVVGALLVAAANVAAFWPIYLVIAAIAAIVAIVILVIKNWGTIVNWLGEQWTRFIGFVKVQIAIFVAVLKAGAQLFHDAFVNAWSAITGVFARAGAWFHDHVWQPIADKFGQVFGGLQKTALGIWSTITGGVKAAFNDVIDLINHGISAVNSVTGKVGIPAIPYLPHLSTGGIIPPGTFAIVGDPTSSELVYGGTGGATVYNHGQSQAMLSDGLARASGSGGGGGGGRPQEVHVHIYLDSQEIAHYTAEPTAAQVVARLFGHGPVREAA